VTGIQPDDLILTMPVMTVMPVVLGIIDRGDDHSGDQYS